MVICGDLKVIAILMGMQTGYTKYCCLICKWDSRDRKHHYIQENWPIIDGMQPGSNNVCRVALIERDSYHVTSYKAGAHDEFRVRT
ncbi:MAG: hypothetical protein ACEY3K_12655 [Wolbachia sp.]